MVSAIGYRGGEVPAAVTASPRGDLKPKITSSSPSPRPIPVENLRLLILRRLLPCRDAEPEDDLTPTPSVIGGTGQAWDSVLSSQDSASQEVLAEPPGAAEDTKLRSSREETDETGPAAEEPSSYKVVRKGRGVTAKVLGRAGGGTRTGGTPLLSLTCPSLGPGVSLPACLRALRWIGAGGSHGAPRAVGGPPLSAVCTPRGWGL